MNKGFRRTRTTLQNFDAAVTEIDVMHTVHSMSRGTNQMTNLMFCLKLQLLSPLSDHILQAFMQIVIGSETSVSTLIGTSTTEQRVQDFRAPSLLARFSAL